MVRIDYKECSLEMALVMLGLNEKKDIMNGIGLLIKEGYSTKGIIYSLSKRDVQDKLHKYISDSRLMSIFMNEVRKYAFNNSKSKQ